MANEKKILRVLKGGKETVPPVWLMRQAGRYLPEYQEVRAKAGGFLDLVFNPDLAAEVTLQPIRRFGFDAAILFSDILVVPQALGTRVWFEEGEGPRLDPVTVENAAVLANKNLDLALLNPIFETVGLIREGLQREGLEQTALIGFAGAPWTVACYMIEGGGSDDYAQARKWVSDAPQALGQLIDALTDVTAAYLIKQIASGAEIVQIFDSWAGLLKDPEDFRRWVIEPTQRIVAKVRQFYPDVPVIGFPRGAGPHYRAYIEATHIQAVGLDQHVTMNKAQKYQSLIPVQGNLDPGILKTGEMLEASIDSILETLSAGPHIFNLGHGIHKDTPPAHVTRLMTRIRKAA